MAGNSPGIQHRIACLGLSALVLSTLVLDAPVQVAASGPVGYGPADFQSAYSLPNWSASGHSLSSSLYRQGTIVVAGHLFLIGGNDGNGARTAVLAAPLNGDGTIGSWVAQPSLPRAVQSAAVVTDGASHIWVVGGDDGTSVLSDVYVGSVDMVGSLGGWTATASLPVPVTDASAVFAAGHVILTGGATQGLTTTPISTILVAAANANGTLGSWLPNVFSLPVPLRRHSAVVAQLPGANYLVVTGGLGATGQPTASVYEGTINTAGAVGQMSAQVNSLPVGLFDHRSVFYKGNIVVAGGSDANSSSLGSVYYSPVTAAGVISSPDCTSASCWYASYNALPQPLADAGAIASNGQLVVIGGLNSFTASVSPQVYTIPFNVATGTSLKGSPATIGIVMWTDDIKAEDELKAYRSAFGLPYCATDNGCFKKSSQMVSSRHLQSAMMPRKSLWTSNWPRLLAPIVIFCSLRRPIRRSPAWGQWKVKPLRTVRAIPTSLR
jgi:hypothetical protein